MSILELLPVWPVIPVGQQDQVRDRSPFGCRFPSSGPIPSRDCSRSGTGSGSGSCHRPGDHLLFGIAIRSENQTIRGLLLCLSSSRSGRLIRSGDLSPVSRILSIKGLLLVRSGVSIGELLPFRRSFSRRIFSVENEIRSGIAPSQVFIPVGNFFPQENHLRIAPRLVLLFSPGIAPRRDQKILYKLIQDLNRHCKRFSY